MHRFFKLVRKLPVWHKGYTTSASMPLQDDAEIMFLVIFAIFEGSALPHNQHGEDDALQVFCEQNGISAYRRKHLQAYATAAKSEIKALIVRKGYRLFLEAYLRLCLHDRKIEYCELRLIYLAARHLGIPLHDVTLYYRKALTSLRYRAIVFFERPSVSVLVTSIILLNAIQLGMMTTFDWLTPKTCPWFFKLDFAFMILFSLEILCRIWAFRREYFTQPQNWFDFLVILLAWLPLPGARHIAPLRSLRALLLVNRLKQLKIIMKSLLSALPSIGWVFTFMALFFYVFAVLTTFLFGQDFDHFSTIPKSLFTLFQLMTLEGWPDLLRGVMTMYPYAWLLFIPFMLITSYILLNLVVGIIVNAMEKHNDGNVNHYELDEIEKLHQEVNHLDKKLAEIQRLLMAHSMTNQSRESIADRKNQETKKGDKNV